MRCYTYVSNKFDVLSGQTTAVVGVHKGHAVAVTTIP